MTISLKTQKTLWGRAANRCSICRTELVIDANETKDASVLGDVCHIISKSPNGPRGLEDLANDSRDAYTNLILLCKNHHKLVDDQPSEYTVDRLIEIRTKHESWVTESLERDRDQQSDQEAYAVYVDEWEKTLRLSEWNEWTSNLLSFAQPCLSVDRKTALEQICPWLLSRVWPGRFPQLEAAFLNFRLVTQDLSAEFGKHAVRIDEIWDTEKFYKIRDWNPERYRILADQYNRHVALVQDLTLELTRAANYVCDRVRDYVFEGYRVKEGVLLTTSGPNMDLSILRYRTEYRGEERVHVPYPGLSDFKTARFERDFCFGRKGET